MANWRWAVKVTALAAPLAGSLEYLGARVRRLLPALSIAAQVLRAGYTEPARVKVPAGLVRPVARMGYSWPEALPHKAEPGCRVANHPRPAVAALWLILVRGGLGHLDKV